MFARFHSTDIIGENPVVLLTVDFLGPPVLRPEPKLYSNPISDLEGNAPTLSYVPNYPFLEIKLSEGPRAVMTLKSRSITPA